jgi:hypothetical protein
MRQFFVSALLLAMIPMVLLNPLGREAFIGYYVGVIAMWFVFVCVGKVQRGAQPPPRWGSVK